MMDKSLYPNNSHKISHYIYLDQIESHPNYIPMINPIALIVYPIIYMP
jgi:hypothetical protein